GLTSAGDGHLPRPAFSKEKRVISRGMSLEQSLRTWEGDMRKTFRLVPLVLMLCAASTACATGYAYGQGPYRDRGPYGGYNNGSYREVERRAYDNGFRDGV